MGFVKFGLKIIHFLTEKVTFLRQCVLIRNLVVCFHYDLLLIFRYNEPRLKL